MKNLKHMLSYMIQWDRLYISMSAWYWKFRDSFNYFQCLVEPRKYFTRDDKNILETACSDNLWLVWIRDEFFCIRDIWIRIVLITSSCSSGTSASPICSDLLQLVTEIAFEFKSSLDRNLGFSNSLMISLLGTENYVRWKRGRTVLRWILINSLLPATRQSLKLPLLCILGKKRERERKDTRFLSRMSLISMYRIAAAR